MHPRRLLFALLLLSAAAPLAAAPAAQAGGAVPDVVAGLVSDESGGAVVGATVVLVPRAGGVERTTVTDATGRFAIAGVPPGPARLTVRFERFRPLTVTLDGSRVPLHIVLQPAGVSEALTVQGAPLTVERITTGTRTDTPLRDVPQAVSVVTRDLISDQTMKSMADVVRYVPGVGMAQGEGHRDAPVFRGNVSTSDFFVDGIRDDTQHLRDLYNVERVEVLKGPNGMVFGRGGVGGVINRVTRQADWTPSRELVVQGGAWDHRRILGDVGHAVNPRVALRLTGVYENSGSYRDSVGLERYGVNPTVALVLGPGTTLRASYEFFHDERTTDRGVPSYAGTPLDTDRATFFGHPEASRADFTVHALSSVVEHRFSDGLTLRNRARYADYDKFYQNVYPGSVDASRTMVSVSGYNNATARRNFFNQTDLILSRRTGRFDHTLLVGAEIGRQVTDNRRLTAHFFSISPTATTIQLPVDRPTTSLPVTFLARASDATNHGTATAAAVYVQDQVGLTSNLEAVVGVRYERFTVDLRDNRTGTELTGDDGLLSPRLGLVYKPVAPLSLYASYSLAHLPRAGEQLASLSLSNQALDPETFRNYEVGAKWDVTPSLSLTAALYRLDRGNIVVADPLDPTRSLLADAQRSTGLEVGFGGALSAKWSVVGGYAYQNGELTEDLSPTLPAGTRLAQLPEHSFSVWNRYDVHDRWGLGLGVIHQGEVFASASNLVTLPAFTRLDAALFVDLTERLRAQANVENLLDERYYPYAHTDNNITPGSPRALRISLIARF